MFGCACEVNLPFLSRADRVPRQVVQSFCEMKDRWRAQNSKRNVDFFPSSRAGTFHIKCQNNHVKLLYILLFIESTDGLEPTTSPCFRNARGPRIIILVDYIIKSTIKLQKLPPHLTKR